MILHQASVNQVHPPETWVLVLNRYQRDNLLWLLHAIGYPYPTKVEPFHLANTGDWVGEIHNMLGARDHDEYAKVSFEPIRSNHTLDELAADVAKWTSRRCDEPGTQT